jgi:hypothetical protein
VIGGDAPGKLPGHNNLHGLAGGIGQIERNDVRCTGMVQELAVVAFHGRVVHNENVHLVKRGFLRGANKSNERFQPPPWNAEMALVGLNCHGSGLIFAGHGVKISADRRTDK